MATVYRIRDYHRLFSHYGLYWQHWYDLSAVWLMSRSSCGSRHVQYKDRYIELNWMSPVQGALIITVSRLDFSNPHPPRIRVLWQWRVGETGSANFISVAFLLFVPLPDWICLPCAKNDNNLALVYSGSWWLIAIMRMRAAYIPLRRYEALLPFSFHCAYL